jgi:hypothetical protein
MIALCYISFCVASTVTMYPDQAAHPCSLIRIHAVCYQSLLVIEFVSEQHESWIHAGRKPTMLVLL